MPTGRVKAVRKHFTGSELTAAPHGGVLPALDVLPAPDLYPEGTVGLDVLDIDEFAHDGGRLTIGGRINLVTETHDYYPIAEDSSTIETVDEIIETYEPEEQVQYVAPLGIRRFAEVQEAGQEEPLEVVITHPFFDKLDTGIRAEGSEELVDFEREGEALLITDVVGKAPNTDGQFLNEESVAGSALDATAQAQAGISTATAPRSNKATAAGVVNAVTIFDDLGGPEIDLEVPVAGIVEVYVECDIRATGGGEGFVLVVDDLGNGKRLLTGPTASYATYASLPGSVDGVETSNLTGEWVIFPTPAGSRTLKLIYGISGGPDADFRNRDLWGRTYLVG